MAAAPADYRLATPVPGKISKEGRSSFTLELVTNPDVVAGLGAAKRSNQVVVGFALEAGEGAEARALAKLERKNLDAIVLNGPGNLGGDRASAAIYRRSGGAPRRLLDVSKGELARELVREVEELVRD
jgi:phosphopantothenoylcysteine decarboxylase/phosphopantothenate--cysteine ligase